MKIKLYVVPTVEISPQSNQLKALFMGQIEWIELVQISALSQS